MLGRTAFSMTPPPDFDALKMRLIEIQPTLPKRLRQVAAFALENPDEIALGTAASVAGHARVQASTLVRFAQSIGFSGFSDLQEIFRSRLRNRWPDYPARMMALHAEALDSGDPTQLLAGFADSATASLARLRESVTRESLERAVDALATARTIYLLGQRRAFPVSHYLAYALAKLGAAATLVDNVGSLGAEQLAHAGPDDALIAISFAPYTPVTVELTRDCAARGVPIVVITDSPLSPLAGHATARFEVAESDFGAFRSLSATFCLAITLAVALANRRDGAA
jgi:DNA-binding MurR/RpiR family transcriptional regulator